MLRQTRRTFPSRHPRNDGHGEMPFFAIARSMNAIWRKPANRIAPQRKTTRRRTTGGVPAKPPVPSVVKHMRKTSAAIQTTLRMLGMRAAAAKRPKAFSTPIPNAAAQMKSM